MVHLTVRCLEPINKKRHRDNLTRLLGSRFSENRLFREVDFWDELSLPIEFQWLGLENIEILKQHRKTWP